SAAASGPVPCGASALLLLRAIAATRLLTVADTLRIERAANDLVTNARQVLHSSTADKHHRVFLQVVTLAGDIGRDLDAAGQLHTCDLAQRRVRLLRRGGVHASAHAAPLRASLERRGLLFGSLVLAALTDQLLDRGQLTSFLLRRAVSVVVFADVFRSSATIPAPEVGRVGLDRDYHNPAGGRICHSPRSTPMLTEPGQSTKGKFHQD